MNALAAAMTYIARGWSVIPIQPGCKTPLIKWKEFIVRSPTREELRIWFEHTDYNIAVVTGRVSGLYALDCDTERAREWALAHCAATRMSQSANGGLHLWYRLAEGIVQPNRVNLLGLRLDARGEGGYVLVEPSRLASGGRYHWINQLSLALWDSAWIPPSLPTAELSRAIECSDYDRRRERARLYVARIDSISGQGGEKQLFRAAMALVANFRLDPQDALEELRVWNCYKAKPIWPVPKLERTIHQALKYRPPK